MNLVARSSRLNLEIGGCFVIWTGSVLYSIYKLKLASKVLEDADDVYGDFSSGFFFLNRKKDIADFEWQNSKQLFFSLAPWLTFNFLVSEYLRATKRFRCLPVFQTTISIFYILLKFNTTVLAITVSQPIAFQLLGKFRSKRCVWMCGITFLLVLHAYKSIPLEYYFEYVANSEYQHLQSIVSFAWINLRCWSYYSDLADKKSSSSTGNFSSVLAYCLYLPLLYSGPFVHYRHFEASQQLSTLAFQARLKTLLCGLLRFLFWMFMTETFLHFIYVNAISYQPQLVDGFDSWTRCGLCYSMGQFFHLKYVVLYGISTSLAKAENITVPDVPKCIGRIHLYSDMWKYFDCGLHTFLLRYIYIPVLKFSKRQGFLIKAQGAALCFLFVFVWHGVQLNIFIWAALNYMGVMSESLFYWLYKLHWKDNYDEHLRSTWKTRIGCVLAAPLLAVSATSSTYFFAGTEVGNIFFKHLVQDGPKSALVLILVLYCNCQFSNYLRKAKTEKVKSK